ncbi:MAG: hypothetical protein K9J74_11960, partial [Sulfuritalea sp.]|nr:hypothetical protein [Sulfuritalea sp.]
IAPGGGAGIRLFREKLGATVTRARQLVSDGKGDEKTELADFEGRRGTYPISTSPAIYLDWFNPDGAMSMKRAATSANPQVPILWMVPLRDSPGLRKVNLPMFDLLPRNPSTRMTEPDSDHIGAPAAAVDEIVRWTSEVAAITSR